jgi:hypothetical protein
MNTSLKAVFDIIPDDPPRSRLEPYSEPILRWARDGKSQRRIRQLLAEYFKVEVNQSTVRRFIKRRSRPRVSAKPALAAEPQTEQVFRKPAVVEQARLFDSGWKKYTPEELAAMREAAPASNHKPTVPVSDDPRPVFHYDPDEPLTNKPRS